MPPDDERGDDPELSGVADGHTRAGPNAVVWRHEPEGRQRAGSVQAAGRGAACVSVQPFAAGGGVPSSSGGGSRGGGGGNPRSSVERARGPCSGRGKRSGSESHSVVRTAVQVSLSEGARGFEREPEEIRCLQAASSRAAGAGDGSGDGAWEYGLLLQGDRQPVWGVSSAVCAAAEAALGPAGEFRAGFGAAEGVQIAPTSADGEPKDIGGLRSGVEPAGDGGAVQLLAQAVREQGSGAEGVVRGFTAECT